MASRRSGSARGGRRSTAPCRSKTQAGGARAEGRPKIDAALPINTDGGCIACGEPIGASGLRQVYENVVQLRGAGGARQVPGAPKTAYTHVSGAPRVSAAKILR